MSLYATALCLLAGLALSYCDDTLVHYETDPPKFVVTIPVESDIIAAKSDLQEHSFSIGAVGAKGPLLVNAPCTCTSGRCQCPVVLSGLGYSLPVVVTVTANSSGMNFAFTATSLTYNVWVPAGESGMFCTPLSNLAALCGTVEVTETASGLQACPQLALRFFGFFDFPVQSPCFNFNNGTLTTSRAQIRAQSSDKEFEIELQSFWHFFKDKFRGRC